jgi:glycosyltransferase involved in cell wall biosynthesis
MLTTSGLLADYQKEPQKVCSQCSTLSNAFFLDGTPRPPGFPLDYCRRSHALGHGHRPATHRHYPFARCRMSHGFYSCRCPGLARSLPTLLAQDYPHYEVIVVDDRSSDRTPRILEEFARLHKNLRVIPLTELPPGWLGKSHALATAHAHATGDWLIFTDADVRFAPDLARRALASAKRKGWDHLTTFFTPDMAGFWEKTVLSFWLFSLILWLEPWKVSDPKSPRYAGSGAFQLLRRSAYEAIGTHRRLALEVVEDLKLGKLVKVRGFRSGMALSDGMVRVRWHEGLHGIIHGLTKNSFAACNYRISRLALNLLLLFTFQILPYLALIFARGIPQALAAVSVLVLLILRLRADHYHEIPRGYALTHPLGAII